MQLSAEHILGRWRCRGCPLVLRGRLPARLDGNVRPRWSFDDFSHTIHTSLCRLWRRSLRGISMTTPPIGHTSCVLLPEWMVISSPLLTKKSTATESHHDERDDNTAPKYGPHYLSTHHASSSGYDARDVPPACCQKTKLLVATPCSAPRHSSFTTRSKNPGHQLFGRHPITAAFSAHVPIT